MYDVFGKIAHFHSLGLSSCNFLEVLCLYVLLFFINLINFNFLGWGEYIWGYENVFLMPSVCIHS
jgi:hypothetical protein